MSVNINELRRKFRTLYQMEPVWCARAPGRVNLIGEHIDYNGGFVLPVAINRDIAMAAAPSVDRSFSLTSLTYEQPFGWDLDSRPHQSVEEEWPNYFLAVVEQLHQKGMYPPPICVAIDGDVPTAAGLSSSAAFEVCTGTLLLAVLGRQMPGKDLALLAQAAEHSPWVGVQCGIMDQFISANAVADRALLVDCGSLEYEEVPLDPEKVSILVVHSTVERQLVASAYNERRSQCEEGLKRLNDRSGQDRHFLTEYAVDELGSWGAELEDPVFRRVRHVITEQERVLGCVRALVSGDLEKAGGLLNASHASLRDDYEVSCGELDVLHEIANEVEGVFGCRMTGAGFGGCAVALVVPELAEEAASKIAAEFGSRFGKEPWTVVTPACESAGVVRLQDE